MVAPEISGLWSWRSPTQAASGLADSLLLLSRQSFALVPVGFTPLSDIRLLPIVSGLYLLTLAILPRAVPFARSRLFVLIAAAHNLALSLASARMFVGIAGAVYRAAASGNISSTVCNPAGSEMAPEFTHWLFIFYVTKFWELLDTAVLVLRGKQLSLLHVLHHACVPWEIYSWLDSKMAVGVWGMLANSGVHILMYSYFAAALLGIRVPWKKAITGIQIVQFCASFASLIPWFHLHRTTPGGCTGSPGLVVSCLCNGAFLLLFVRFYVQTYQSTADKDISKNS
jgi:fatty acid elongase 3